MFDGKAPFGYLIYIFIYS